MVGFQEFPADLDLAGTGQPGGALDHGGAVLLVVLDLGGVVEMADHVVVVVAQVRPVQCRGRHAGGPGRLGARLRAAQQRLGRDARPVGALTADQLPLDQRHSLACGEQTRRRGLSAHAHPDDDHVEPVHLGLLITMTVAAGTGRPRPQGRPVARPDLILNCHFLAALRRAAESAEGGLRLSAVPLACRCHSSSGAQAAAADGTPVLFYDHIGIIYSSVVR